MTVPGSVSSSNTAANDVVHRIRAAAAHAGAPPGLDLHLAGPLAVEVLGALLSVAGSGIALVVTARRTGGAVCRTQHPEACSGPA